MRIFITFALVVVCTVAVNGRSFETRRVVSDSEDWRDYPEYDKIPSGLHKKRQERGPNPSPTFGLDLLESARRHATELGQEAGNRIIKVLSGVQEALGNRKNNNNNNYDDYDQNTANWSNGNTNSNKHARRYYGNQQQDQEDRTQQNNHGNQQNDDVDYDYPAKSTPDRFQNSRENRGSNNGSNNGQNNEQRERRYKSGKIDY